MNFVTKSSLKLMCFLLIYYTKSGTGLQAKLSTCVFRLAMIDGPIREQRLFSRFVFLKLIAKVI